jgi:hypothetical protein
MVQTFDNLLNQEELQELLDYFYIDDELTDAREFVRSKHPKWGETDWPEHLIKRVCDSVLDEEYEVEEVVINDSKISFQIHTDNGYSNDKSYKGVLIPLTTFGGVGSTVYFDNYYHGDAAKFVSSEDPYKNHKRDETKNLTTQDQRIHDYSVLENYTGHDFPRDDYENYLNHIPYENLHGLKLDRVVEWQPGSAIVFDRNQLHAASSQHQRKIGISVFVNKK